jgi:ribulose-5-phosphate 4-epimerase/fuculose-1-phosphate aldolase
MASARRLRRALPAGRAARLGRHDLHAHLHARARAGSSFPDQSVRHVLRGDDRLDGNIVSPTPYYINPAGFTIHSAIHGAREDALCVIHLHTDAGVGVSAQKEGLLPLTQNALLVIPQLAYHGYEGVALNLDERARLVADIGDKKLMLLRNHGTLAVGMTAADAFVGIFFLERACAEQVAALSAGRDHVLIAPEAAQQEALGPSKGLAMVSGLAWPGLKRKLDRQLPGYDS